MKKGPVRRVILPNGQDMLTAAGAAIAGPGSPLSVEERVKASMHAAEPRQVIPTSMDMFRANPVLFLTAIARQLVTIPDILLTVGALERDLDKLNKGRDVADIATLQVLTAMATFQAVAQSIIAPAAAAVDAAEASGQELPAVEPPKLVLLERREPT